MSSIFRIHPAIGLSRVGNSVEYNLAPESIAALPLPDADGPTTGGLPINPVTDEIITSSDLRERDDTELPADQRRPGALKRQAARFRIFVYPEEAAGTYPAAGGEELTIGSTVTCTVDGVRRERTVSDIVWTVHVANKKAASFESDDDHGVHAYENGQTPVLRNLAEGFDPHNVLRLRKLIIDAGPRTVRGADHAAVGFTRDEKASYAVGGTVHEIDQYPMVFPDTHFPVRDEPQGPITTLGEVRTDRHGHLIVTGGHGKSVGWPIDPDKPDVPLDGPVNNDQWFDDTSDGPVSASVVFDDGTVADAHGAWVITTDPSYAPQTLNVVSLWDEAYDTFVRQFGLDPEIYADGRFNTDYQPSFADHVRPVFVAAAQQLWNTYLPRIAIDAHDAIGAIGPHDDPNHTIMAGLAFIRRPDPDELHTWKAKPSDVGAPLMPLSLGDTSAAGGKSFLAPSVLQYFFLDQWAAGSWDPEGRIELGHGEYLDRASLQNCLGGRFSPGIDIGFVIRAPEMYEDWTTGAGPFRIKHEPLHYGEVMVNGQYGPFLSLGWLPRHPDVADRGLQPGDLSKFLALPWHADYNSCAIHQTSPNPLNSNALYWSWPGQRPVTVYTAEDYEGGGRDQLPDQRYSVRGPGTMPGVDPPIDKGDPAKEDPHKENLADEDLANAGRFWKYRDMLTHWDKIGTIVQATIIDDEEYRDDSAPPDVDPTAYLEVQSQLEDGPAELAAPHPWPIIGGPGTAKNPDVPSPDS